MHIDIFSQGKSVLHGLDPRGKILAFIPLAFVVALLPNAGPALFYLGIACVFIVAARVNGPELMNRVIVLNLFMSLLWLTVPFNMEGRALLIINGLTFSAQGARYVLTVTFKANAILLFTVALIGTTDVFALAHALFHLKFPRKLVYLFIFLYRYISVLHDEYDRLVKTAKARCFHPGTNTATWRAYAYMVGMLFINSYERSQRIYQALTLRGFRGDFPMLRHFHRHRSDTVFAWLMAFIILLRFVIWR